MTREEAHRILSNGLANAPSEHEWCVAFEMAIKALEQEMWIPCSEKSPDKDERLALLYDNGLVSGGKYLGDKTYDVDFPDQNKKTRVVAWTPIQSSYKVESKEEIESMFDNAKKIGNWIYNPETDLANCSNCGASCPSDKYGRIEVDYCPNCNSFMKKLSKQTKQKGRSKND